VTRVLVTGANGFVGSLLCPLLAAAGYTTRAALRTGRPSPQGASEQVTIDDIGPRTDWSRALDGVDLIVHLAALAHAAHEGADPAPYEDINAKGTARLASAAAQYGVRRLIYLSSVKANGEEREDPYHAEEEPRPQGPYGVSKWHAEQSLWQALSGTATQGAVVRAPLVYGPGVRANFERLLSWIDGGRPLPFAALRNRRSLVSGWTLCDLLLRLLTHSAAVGRTWMVSDGEDVSTPELVTRIARAMGRQPRLLRVPPPLLLGLGRLLGRGAQMRRLCESLTVDIAPTRRQLDWTPAMTMDEALSRTVTWYCSRERLWRVRS
jgi:nucleoside-diphosphate-sugar epimerase